MPVAFADVLPLVVALNKHRLASIRSSERPRRNPGSALTSSSTVAPAQVKLSGVRGRSGEDRGRRGSGGNVARGWRGGSQDGPEEVAVKVRDVAEDAVDHLRRSPALSLGFSQGEGVSIKPREEQERVVLGELEALVDDRKRGDLGELLGEQGAEPCRHLVTYVHQVREVGRDLRIVCRELRVRGGRRTGRHVARIL